MCVCYRPSDWTLNRVRLLQAQRLNRVCLLQAQRLDVEPCVRLLQAQRLDVVESEMFPNYFAPLSIVPDHSLPVELPLATFSPNSLLMYEHESDRQAGGRVCQASAASCGGRGVDMAAFGDVFDLNPMMEQSNDLLSLVDDDFGASSWTTEAMKVRT